MFIKCTSTSRYFGYPITSNRTEKYNIQKDEYNYNYQQLMLITIKHVWSKGYRRWGIYGSYRSSSSFVSYNILGLKSFLHQQYQYSISYRILGPWDLADPVSFTQVHIVHVHFVPDLVKDSIRKWLCLSLTWTTITVFRRQPLSSETSSIA